MRIALAIFVLFTSIGFVSAQEQSYSEDDIYDMSLEELMQLTVTVASKTDLTVRESPAVLSVITSEDIRNLGARDMIDVLNLVPGMSFGVDVYGVVGLGVRGNWAHEGKALVLLDGQEINDILYGTVDFGQRFDISTIDRIEIIRGPGSSIYGGYAELGVINIITRGGDRKGITATANYGSLNDTYGRRNLSVSMGNDNGKVNYSISGFASQGHRSNLDFVDYAGQTVNLTNFTEMQQNMVNASVKVQNLSARLIYDNYRHGNSALFGEFTGEPLDDITFGNLYAELKYDWKSSDRLTITPRVNYKTGKPWSQDDQDNPNSFDLTATRVAPSLNFNWSADAFNLVAGVDSYFDKGVQNDNSITEYFITSGTNEVTYNNVGLFAQGQIKGSIPLFIGARFDNHSQFGSAFSPRIGLTKTLKNWHAKLLYSRAFRAPAIETINIEPTLDPERTGVAEFELGYQINSNMFITANLFDIQISDPIIYDLVDESTIYGNFGRTGSRGLEISYRMKTEKIDLNANYSFSTTNGINTVEAYKVPGNDNVNLGMPMHKINVYGTYKITNDFNFSPSITWLSAIQAFGPSDELVTLGERAFVNMYFTYRNAFVNGLTMGAGVYDLFDVQQRFAQPYTGGHPPMPGVGREILVCLRYNLSFNSKN